MCVQRSRGMSATQIHSARVSHLSLWRPTDVIWRHQWRLNLPWSRSYGPWLNGGLGGKSNLNEAKSLTSRCEPDVAATENPKMDLPVRGHEPHAGARV